MSIPFKLQNIKLKPFTRLSSTSKLLKQTQRFQQNYHHHTHTYIKRNSLQNLKLHTKFLTRLIDQQYQLNQPKSQIFQNSLIFYTNLINDPNKNDRQFKQLMLYIDNRYNFKDSPQQLGLLISYLTIQKVDYPQQKKYISQIIQKLYMFSDKDRSFCDSSKIMYFKIIDIIEDFTQERYIKPMNYIGWQHYQRIQSIFQQFYFNKQNYFRQLWMQFKLNQDRYQHQVAMLIQRIIDMKNKTPFQKCLHLFGFLFLIKFLKTQHNYTDNKLSQQLIKTIRSVIAKLSYIIINIDFYHMNWFLILYKFVMQNKQIFGQSRLKMQLAMFNARVYFNDNRMQYFNNIAEQFCEKTKQQTIFKDYEKQIHHQFPHIATLTLLTQNPSQLLSYGSPFNQRRKASYQSISKYLSQNNNQKKSYLPLYKINTTLMAHKSQILKYTEEKLQKQQYMQLLVSLQQIYLMFQNKVYQLTDAIADDMRHQKLKDLQTWYVASYMKILLQLKSQSNNLYKEGYMPIDFISQFYYEIISRFAQLTMTDIDFHSLYNVLYLEYSINDTIIFDIESQRFGLKELFQALGQRQVLMGSSASIYQIQTLRKYYNIACNGSIVMQKFNTNNGIKNDKKTQMQKFIQRILNRKQLMGKKMKQITQSTKKKQLSSQKFKQSKHLLQQNYQSKQKIANWTQTQNDKQPNNRSNQKTNSSNKTINTSTNPFFKSIIPNFSQPGDVYTQQFIKSSTKNFPLPSTIPYSFIKTEILRLIQTYLVHYPILPLNDRKAFYEIFCCLVIVIDNEAMLMEIYANILFKLLSDQKQQLVIDTYQSLSMVRKLHSEKFQYSFKHTNLARKHITCIFEKLRKIEIKRNRQKNKNFSNSVMTNPIGGKQKASITNMQLKQQQHSKVYIQYFQQLFRTPSRDVLTYGRQLFSLGKYKQCIYVLEVTRQQIQSNLKNVQQNLFYGNQNYNSLGQRDRKQIEKMMIECDLLLSDCYATLVKKFHSMQPYINKKCIYNKIQDKSYLRLLKKKMRQQFKNIDNNQHSNDTQNIDTPHLRQRHSLTSTLTQLVTNKYRQHTTKNYFPSEINSHQQIDASKIIYQQESFRSTCYLTIFYQCYQRINSICTMDDLQLFYTKTLLGGVIYGWYQEKYFKLMTKMMTMRLKQDMSNNNNKMQQFPDEDMLSDGDFSQQSIISNPTQQKLPVYQQLLRSFCHTITSKSDKLSLINMISIIECQNKEYNFQTIRMLNQSLLENKKQNVIFACLKKYYGGVDKFQNMGLLDLQLMQKYHYVRENYQHVKAITKYMKYQQQFRTYGQKETYYPNWPQVYGYQLISKIYDLNCVENPDKYWKDLAKIIIQQKYVVVQGKKFSLEKLRNSSQLVKNIEKSSPKIFAKLIIELEAKIKQYFNLLRIIFSKLCLSKNQGSLSIFEIMQHIYRRMFIPLLTKQQINIDFFLYYLRFLCEKVDPKFFLIRQVNYEKMKKRMQQFGQANQQQQFIYTKKKLIQFLLQNLPYVKHHTLYMIRSMDPQVNTQKNFILRDILVQSFVKNPVENLWTLTYLKYYEKKMPQSKKETQKSYDKKNFDKKKQREEFISRYLYPEDSAINQIHNAAIQQLYKAVIQHIDPSQYNQLTMIPLTFMQWLEKTAMQKIDEPTKPGEMFYFAKNENIQKQRDEINKKIRLSKYRIPYPFDHRLFIRSVQKVKLSIHEGKSMPCFVSFICGMYSDFNEENKYLKTGKNTGFGSSQTQINQSSTIIQKHILLKNNFSTSDHRIETNTANFYKQIGLLDDQTTYGIINLTKYILLIEKICVPHKSIKELLQNAYNFDTDHFAEMRMKFINQIKKDCSNLNYLIQPKWFDKSTQIRKNNQKGPMFYHFYNRSIQDYNNINQWWAYMQNYVRTLAFWSYVCFVTKLGDRHLTNILISDTGKFIHIDYQYNFGHGLMLPYPEWMPFRLTDLMVQPLGVFKEKGLFLAYFVEIAKIFNPNQEKIWKALCHFSSTQRQLIEDTSKFNTITTLNSLEEKCQKVIDLAMDKSLLRLMFPGWNPNV